MSTETIVRLAERHARVVHALGKACLRGAKGIGD
jgi:hypothetical protein